MLCPDGMWVWIHEGRESNVTTWDLCASEPTPALKVEGNIWSGRSRLAATKYGGGIDFLDHLRLQATVATLIEMQKCTARAVPNTMNNGKHSK